MFFFQLARKDWTQFIIHMKEIFSTIIALVCHVPLLIPTVFHSLPYLELPKVRIFKTELIPLLNCEYRIAQKFDKQNFDKQNFDKLIVGFKGETSRGKGKV